MQWSYPPVTRSIFDSIFLPSWQRPHLLHAHSTPVLGAGRCDWACHVEYAMEDVQISLLSAPKPEDEEFVEGLPRESCRYENLSERFRTPAQRKYGLQYSHIYFVRLTKMKRLLVDAAKQRWGESRWERGRRARRKL